MLRRGVVVACSRDEVPIASRVTVGGESSVILLISREGTKDLGSAGVSAGDVGVGTGVEGFMVCAGGVICTEIRACSIIFSCSRVKGKVRVLLQ